MDRREFLELGGGVLLVAASSAYGVRLLTQLTGVKAPEGIESGKLKWGMLVDLTKCREGCTACIDACHKENNVAQHDNELWDVHWLRKARLRDKHREDAPEKRVLLLCNHCDQPPCAQVCPVQATYKRHDGIVIVDHHRCIGCRYCVVACPYNARFFNWKGNEKVSNEGYPARSHGVAESCTLCAHRLDDGKTPRCVEACAAVEANALKVGDLNDPEDEISKLIAASPTKRIREDLATEPKVYYIGL